MISPIIFIHGFGGGSYEFQPIISYLKKKGYSKFYEFVYEKRFGQKSIKDIASEFSAFVARKVKEKELIIIGISQGGIIAEYYLKYFNRKKVNKLITLCTPHKGSLMAHFSSLPGFIDLRSGSKMLLEMEQYIKKSRIRLYSVYTPFDLMVFPGWNANPSHGKVKIVFAPVHPLAFWWPSTLRFIEDCLEE